MKALSRVQVQWTALVLIIVCIRFVTVYWAPLSSRIELGGPTTAASRLNEARFLRNHGQSIYAGSVYHGTPLLVLVPHCVIYPLFACIDIVAALALSRASVVTSHFTSSCSSSRVIAAVYALNPPAILGALSHSTAALSSSLLALSIAASAHHRPVAAGALCAAAAYFDLHMFLATPAIIILMLSRSNASSTPSLSTLSNTLKQISLFLGSVLLTIIALLVASYRVERSWAFLEHSYLFTLRVTDLTPSIGVFWYFVTEIFTRFRVFFLCCFHLHLFVYVVPLAVRLFTVPWFMLYCILITNALFKPYPVLSDHSLPLTLLAINAPLLRGSIRRIHVAVILCLFAACFGVTMWHLWIYPGSGNANFFYNQTLIFALSHCFIVAESIAAVRKKIESSTLKSSSSPVKVD